MVPKNVDCILPRVIGFRNENCPIRVDYENLNYILFINLWECWCVYICSTDPYQLLVEIGYVCSCCNIYSSEKPQIWVAVNYRFSDIRLVYMVHKPWSLLRRKVFIRITWPNRVKLLSGYWGKEEAVNV